jgi:hypothetical protein
VTRQRRPRCPPPSVQTRTTSVAVCSSCVSMLATVAAGRHPIVTRWVPAVEELLDLGRGLGAGWLSGRLVGVATPPKGRGSHLDPCGGPGLRDQSLGSRRMHGCRWTASCDDW